MKKILFTAAFAIACYLSHATNKLVVANIGSGWSNANNFLPTGVPQGGDVITVPLGLTITIKGNVYGSSNPSIKLHVFGTLDFDPSGKLSLASTSIIQIYGLGKITTNGTSSEIITIGGVVKYNGQNDGELLGPLFAAGGPETSTTLKAGSGFLAGVLPIEFVSFEGIVLGFEIVLHWKTSGSNDIEKFVVQRKNEREWEDIEEIIAGEEKLSYTFKDKNASRSSNLYRIKMLDKNGSTLFSDLRSINLTGFQSSLSIAPNPAAAQAKISWKKLASKGKLALMNNMGVVVFEAEIEKGSNSFNLNLQTFGKGIYQILIWDDKTIMEKTSIIHY